MNDSLLSKLLDQPHETRSFECKRGDSWQALRSKIARTALAMSNTRDGGTIVIGVEEVEIDFEVTGLTEPQAASFKADDVIAFINKYADPSIDCTVSKQIFTGKVLVVIEVREFRDIPVLCKKNDSKDLVEGSLYTRSFSRIESHPIRSQTEMRDLIDLAVEKALRAFTRTASSAGIPLQQVASAEPNEVRRTQLLADTSSLYGGQPLLLTDIRIDNRYTRQISQERLSEIVRKCSVSSYGWYYPAVFEDDILNGDGHVQHISRLKSAPSWRFVVDGHFICIENVQSQHFQPESPWQAAGRLATHEALEGFTPSGHIWFIQLIIRVTLFFEFAARYSTELRVMSEMLATVKLINIKDVVLTSESPARLMRHLYRAIEDCRYEVRQSTQSLAANPREHAWIALQDLLPHFQMNHASRDVVEKVQRESLGRL
ncbi:MAG: ATP-binding protein [Planctomycetota bacterium]